jgi:2-keto-4-pentenoate hydratase/2-oxohepta-3-ene-1,7-dioic acid hydratase in catechol pathway
MQLARLLTPDGPIEGEHRDGTIHADDGSYEVGVDGRLLPPAEPSALYCVGKNYAITVSEMDYEKPDQPSFFIKPPASLLAHEEPIRYPPFTAELSYAGELAAVIGQRCSDVAPEDVPDVVRGYTIMNDVDALDQPELTARKAFDGSAPLGPWLETDLDPSDLGSRTTINGELLQEATTDQMLFPVDEIVSFLSARFTLRPGDVIAFGAPSSPGAVEPGDVIELSYEGIGTLRNAVVEP